MYFTKNTSIFMKKKSVRIKLFALIFFCSQIEGHLIFLCATALKEKLVKLTNT